MLQSLTETSVVITWRTDSNSDAVVEYGLTESLDELKIAKAKGKTHEVTLHHLLPGTEYFYRVVSDGEVLSPVTKFRTANPELDTSFSFGLFGDPGKGSQVQYDQADLFLDLGVRFVVLVGDVVTPSGELQNYIPYFFTPYSSILPQVPFWPCLGNHDVASGNGAPYLDAFTLPTNNFEQTERYYSYSYGNAHFMALDGHEPINPGSPQYLWLMNELTQRRREWNFVYSHYPPYSSSFYGPEDTGFAVRDNLGPLFEAYGVDAYFSGHKHHYERHFPIINDGIDEENGVVYIVSGGAGARLSTVYGSDLTAYFERVNHVVNFVVDGDQISAEMMHSDGTVRDQFSMTSRPWTGPVGKVDRAECVLHLRFDDGGGAWAVDSSPYGQDGFLGESAGSDAADPKWLPNAGISGGCLSFDPGSSAEFVTVPDTEGRFDFTESFTLMAWVKSNRPGSWGTVISGGDYKYSLFLSSDGTARGYFDDLSPKETGRTDDDVLDSRDWSHLAMVYEDGEVRIFADGVLVKTSRHSGDLPEVPSIRIGYDGYPGDVFDGEIDEVKVFRRALSTTEVRAEMVTDFVEIPLPEDDPDPGPERRPVESSDLVCQLSFDEPTGQTLLDSSGSGNAGFLGDSASGDAADPLRTTCAKYGPGALQFDGDARARIPDGSGAFDMDGVDWTAMAWVNYDTVSRWTPVLSGGDYEYALYLSTGGTVRAYCRSISPPNTAVSPTGFRAGEWNHVAVVRQDCAFVLYVNGQREMISSSDSGDFSPVDALTIGWDGYDTTHFEGLIDEVKIYRHALSRSEVQSEMEGTFGVPYDPPSTDCEPPPDPGPLPILDLAFETGSGQEILDDSGANRNGFRGTSEAGDEKDPSWVNGQGYGGSNGLDFSGDDQLVNVPDGDGAFDLDDKLTMMAWVRYDDLKSWNCVVSGGTYTYALYVTGNGRLRGYFRNLSPRATPETSAGFNAGQWNHVAMTKDGRRIKLYLNGSEVGSSDHDGSIQNVDRVQVGFGGYPGEGFDGRIDAVRVFDRVLNAAEIQQQMVD